MEANENKPSTPERLEILTDIVNHYGGDTSKPVPELFAYVVDLLESATMQPDGTMTDEQERRARESLEKARGLYTEAQRAWFTAQYAPEIAARGIGYWEFPYTELSFALLAYEQNRFGGIPDDDAAEAVGDAKWSGFKNAHANVKNHFVKVMNAVIDGRFNDVDGNPIIPYDGENIEVISVIDALQDAGFDDEEIFGDTVARAMDGKDGEPGFEPERFGTQYLTLYALVALMGYAEQVREAIDTPNKPEKAETVMLAQYSKTETFQIHDFALKTLNEGLAWIAANHDYYELTPRRGRSPETWKLTASKHDCSEYLKKGGNPEVMKAVIGTVSELKANPQAADFIHNGRIWFTLNKIVEECLRTKAGTIQARKYDQAREVIDAALVTASGSRIQGTNAKGEPTDVVYLIDAIRLDTGVYNGNTYTDVWGFTVDARTVSEYVMEQEKSHAYHYPLLDSRKPFTVDTLAIHEYLSDALNEARGCLYTTTKGGQSQQKKVKTKTIRRAWNSTRESQGIFDLFSPAYPLSSRQKTRIVKQFEDVLTDLVRHEANGRREGMPMYIYAWSERDGSKGRGKGVYVNLVIEASSEFHTVRDGSKARGAINLQDGEAEKKPLDCK